MPDNKQACKSYKQRHLPPTGKKCQFKKIKEVHNNTELLQDAAVASNPSGAQTGESSADGQQLQLKILEQLQRVTERLDQVEDKMAPAIQNSTPDSKLSINSFQ